MRIRLDDLETGLNSLFEEAGPVDCFDLEIEDNRVVLKFFGKNKNACSFFIYSSSNNITPELRTTKKVYRNDLATTARGRARDRVKASISGSENIGDE